MTTGSLPMRDWSRRVRGALLLLFVPCLACVSDECVKLNFTLASGTLTLRPVLACFACRGGILVWNADANDGSYDMLPTNVWIRCRMSTERRPIL